MGKFVSMPRVVNTVEGPRVLFLRDPGIPKSRVNIIVFNAFFLLTMFIIIVIQKAFFHDNSLLHYNTQWGHNNWFQTRNTYSNKIIYIHLKSMCNDWICIDTRLKQVQQKLFGSTWWHQFWDRALVMIRPLHRLAAGLAHQPTHSTNKTWFTTGSFLFRMYFFLDT